MYRMYMTQPPHPQMTNAQMRAVLGMPPGVDDLNVLFLEQQHRAQQEAQQRDMRYRQALYQERLDQQLQELQLRSTVAAQLEDYPDLQQHYRSLLLSEQIQRRNEQEQAFLRQQSEQEQVQRALQAQAAAAAAAAGAVGSGGVPLQHAAAAAAAVAHQQHVPLQQAAAAAAAAAHQQQQQVAAAAAAQTQAAQIQAARLQYEEHLRRQQLQYQEQQQVAALQAARLHGIPLEAMSSVVGGLGGPTGAAGIILANAAAALEGAMVPPLGLLQQQQQLQLQHQLQMQQQQQQLQSLSRTASIDLSAAGTPINTMVNKDNAQKPESSSGNNMGNSNAASKPRKRRSSSLSGSSELNDSQRSRKSRKSNRSSLDGSQGSRSSSRRDNYRMSASPIADVNNEEEDDDDDEDREKYECDHDSDGDESIYNDPSGHALDQVAIAAEMATPEIVRFGTILDILNIAYEEEGSLDAAATLSLFKSTVEWSEDSEKEDEKEEGMEVVPLYEYDDSPGLEVPQDPAESLVTPMLTSYFPKLPEEPVFDEGKGSDDDDESGDDDSDKEKEDYPDDELGEKDKHSMLQTLVDEAAEGGPSSKEKLKGAQRVDESSSSEIISNVLEYPYPVDTWWPSINGRRRERRQAGETSDEDRFDSDRESSNGKKPIIFRANEAKIRKRVATSLEPGVLEKLPHCRVHRLKKKSAIVSELVYCWQVTECYPNDLMVNCSRCGTWRHAACGGHYKPFSNRVNIETPFVAVCENCHEEERYTKDHAKAEQRLQRQRMEHLRRGFATSSVMRNMSFSKHGGTYKWPLGSVSATHTGGHTRSVQARHDKAEKQWSDLATRLSRGYGYRAKERQRVRTKELERLLVSVEDAEGQTDRHNMLLFLMRDTQREVPVGYENYGRNLFDPDEPGMALEDEEPVEVVVEDSTTTTTTTAASNNGNDDDANDTTAPGRIATASFKAKTTAHVSNEVNNDDDEDHAEIEDDEKEDESICIHPNCTRKRRFDSVFCCDACGVSVLETDLLRSFHDSSNLHPSVLRSHY
jgi:hypothetical protein